MKNTVEETAKIGFDQVDAPVQTVNENPLGNILTGIFSNLEGDPNAPEGEQEFDVDEFVEFGKSFFEGLGLGGSLKDAVDKIQSAAKNEETIAVEGQPQVKNINITLNIGDVRFK